MALKKQVYNLSKLLVLRKIEVDRLTTEMENKERTRQRYQRNLELIDSLCADASINSRQLPLSLSEDCAHYKQGLLRMKINHQQDLAYHEVQMRILAQALREAAVKQKSIGLLVERKQNQLNEHTLRCQQKRQDEFACQSWKMSSQVGSTGASCLQRPF